MFSKPHTLVAALAGWLAVSTGSVAQTAVTPPKDSAGNKKDAEVVVLAPFQVQASDNTGWAPSETLAGTRLRTKLSDLASQMEVFTLDFMGEFGFNSVDEASIYSLNIENSTEFVSNVESKGGGEGTLRVRGMGGPRRTREFFATGTRSDNYNLERVTLASGPNPMMFGIGAPTGAIDSTLARPIMNRNSNKVRLQADSFGGMRGEFHVNKRLFADFSGSQRELRLGSENNLWSD